MNNPCSTTSFPRMEPLRLTENQIKDLILLWSADEVLVGEVDPPSEGFMVDITGLSRMKLRELRDEALTRAADLCRSFGEARHEMLKKWCVSHDIPYPETDGKRFDPMVEPS